MSFVDVGTYVNFYEHVSFRGHMGDICDKIISH